jgi:hypothetical protein
MCKFSNLTPSDKRTVLISLIDDMTAAAIDRSSQGYSQFLQCRNELLKTIDGFVEADDKRNAAASDIAKKIQEYFETV